MQRRVLLQGAAAAALAVPAWGRAAPARLPRLVLAGPHAAVSYPFYRLAESRALQDVADAVELRPWKDPDQLRALALDPNAPPQLVAMPTNVAANLCNRGVKLKLLNVSTWGVLWLVSRDPALKTLADFKGREVVMPFRGDMPDIVFQAVAEAQGLDARRDFQLRYVGSPMDAMQLLLTRRAEHALLSEPAVSVALRKTQTLPTSMVAPTLHRAVDLQAEWGRVLKRPARIPQAGVVALGPLLDRPELLPRLQQAYAGALQWCEQQPDACGRLVAAQTDMLSAEGVADSVRADNTAFVTAAEARAELEFFFGVLHKRQPGLVGGKLPEAGFYFGA